MCLGVLRVSLLVSTLRVSVYNSKYECKAGGSPLSHPRRIHSGTLKRIDWKQG